jgi:hypothetical protein
MARVEEPRHWAAQPARAYASIADCVENLAVPLPSWMERRSP